AAPVCMLGQHARSNHETAVGLLAIEERADGLRERARTKQRFEPRRGRRMLIHGNPPALAAGAHGPSLTSLVRPCATRTSPYSPRAIAPIRGMTLTDQR